MPVGTWVIRTAESVVLTLWPPGPLLRKTSMRRSLSSIGHVDLLGLGQHEDAGRAGVHPALGLRDRHPLDPVHAALELEQPERRPARLGRALGLHRDGDRLVAAQVGLGGVEDLDLPALGLGVAGVHPQQVAGEQRGLLAALAGLHLEDRVLVVGGVARHEQPAELLLGGLEAVGQGLGLGGERRVLGGQLAGGLDVRPRARRTRAWRARIRLSSA